jgi:hypothetical protein
MTHGVDVPEEAMSLSGPHAEAPDIDELSALAFEVLDA